MIITTSAIYIIVYTSWELYVYIIHDGGRAKYITLYLKHCARGRSTRTPYTQNYIIKAWKHHLSFKLILIQISRVLCARDHIKIQRMCHWSTLKKNGKKNWTRSHDEQANAPPHALIIIIITKTHTWYSFGARALANNFNN